MRIHLPRVALRNPILRPVFLEETDGTNPFGYAPLCNRERPQF
ncbi:MAG: hypothetical protein ACAI37_27445 [Chthoniobacter sp.]